MASTEVVRTPTPLRLSYPNLFKPQKQDSGAEKYNAVLIIEAGTDLSFYGKLIKEAAVAEWGEKAAEDLRKGLIKNPLKNAANEPKYAERAGFAGNHFIRVVSNYKPPIFRKKGSAFYPLDEDDVYPGMYVYAALNCYTWSDARQGKGVSFGLEQLIKARDGDRLGGGGSRPPEDYFDGIPDTADTRPDVDGDGAADVFG